MLHVLSLVDVLESDFYKGFYKIKDKEKRIERTLHALGMDLSKGYETTLVTHRTTISQKVVTTYRYAGYLRTDKVWNDNLTKVKRRYMMGWL